jgi:hypothetical protein
MMMQVQLDTVHAPQQHCVHDSVQHGRRPQHSILQPERRQRVMRDNTYNQAVTAAS